MSVKSVFTFLIITLYVIGMVFTYCVMKTSVGEKIRNHIVIDWVREACIYLFIWIFSPLWMIHAVYTLGKKFFGSK